MSDKTMPPIGDSDSRPAPIRDFVLFRAGELINGSRAQMYGDAVVNFTTIATYWSTYYNTVIARRGGFLPSDVPMLMILAKIAREAAGFNMDSAIDICGYAALYAEARKGEIGKAESDLKANAAARHTPKAPPHEA